MERPQRRKVLPPRLCSGDVSALAHYGAREWGVLGPDSPGSGAEHPARVALRILRLSPQAPLGAVGFSRRVRARLSLYGPRCVPPRLRALRLLHGLLLGHLLLPPAHRGPEVQLPPVLASRPRELGLDERELPGTDAEVVPRALRTRIPHLRTRESRARRARPRLHGDAGGCELCDAQKFVRLEARLPG